MQGVCVRQPANPLRSPETPFMSWFWQHRWLMLLLFLALALRLGRCASGEGLGRFTSPYYSEYLVAGERLAETGTLVSPLIWEYTPQQPSALMPPAYVGLVGALYAAFGPGSFAAILTLQLINVIATSLAVLLTYSVARRIGGPAAGWIAALFVAFNPMLIGFSNYMWDTSLFTFAAITTVLFSQRLGQSHSLWWKWILFGGWLGAVALLNPALTLAYPLLVLWPATRSGGWRFRSALLPASLTVCGWLIVIAPWIVRNYIQLGELTYVRNGFQNELWLGVCPEAEEHPGAVFASRYPLMNKDAQARISSIGEQAYIEECGRQARAAIAADPLRYVKLVTIRAMDYFAGTTFSHASPGGGGWPKRPLRAIVMLFLSFEILVIVACALTHRKMRSDVVWLLAIIVVFSLVYCLTHVQIRFRSPTEPIIAIVLAVTITECCGAWIKRRALHAET